MNKDNTVYILAGHKNFDINGIHFKVYKEHFLALMAINNDSLTKFGRKLHLPLYPNFYYDRCFIDKCQNVPHYLLKKGDAAFCEKHLFEWAESVGPSVDSLKILYQHLHLWTSDDSAPLIKKELIKGLREFKGETGPNTVLDHKRILYKHKNIFRIPFSFFYTLSMIKEHINERELKEVEEWIANLLSDPNKERDQMIKSICNKFSKSQLQQLAKRRRLDDNGNKDQIAGRILTSFKETKKKMLHGENKRKKFEENEDLKKPKKPKEK